MDNELFELCKSVHDVTGWENENYNLYTSDYLLEKLPKQIQYVAGSPAAVWWSQKLGVWQTGFTRHVRGTDNQKSYTYEAETPLKALLKLTLALSETGELKDE